MIFYYADPHFGHAPVIIYEKRPFLTIREMDEFLIHKYNSTVSSEDTVIWVGDAFLTTRERSHEIMNSLNGTKLLVLGNHDQSASRMMRLGFVYACYEMQIKIAGFDVLVSHYPYRLPEDTYHELKYNSRRPIDNGKWLIHGHVHSNRPRFVRKMVNVGVDVWDFTPVSHSVLEQYIQKTEAALRKDDEQSSSKKDEGIVE